MSLKIRVNGLDYENFIVAQVILSLETVGSSFNFTSSVGSDNLFPIKKGDAVQILADEQVILTGFVEVATVSYDSNSHRFEVKGRNKLADLIDSTVGDVKEFTGQVSLKSIIRSVLDGIGLTDIAIINEAGDIDNFEASDITSAETGQKAFEFIELYARKRQVLLTTNGNSDLVIARASTDVANNALKNEIGNKADNNIIAGSFTNDETKLYNLYLGQSQLNPIGLSSDTTPVQISEQTAQFIDDSIRVTRRLEFNAEESSDSFTMEDRVKWEANIRRARASVYTARVQGHTANGEAWMPNKLYRIDDDFCDVHAVLLSKHLVYNYSLDGGSLTNIEFTNRKAYTLQAEQDAREAEINQFGLSF
jgi:prophage tail gpP-like protein